MKIGIDARLYGTSHTGIGRYVQNLIENLGKIDKKNTYVIFGHPSLKADIEKFPNFKFVKLETKIYSLAEQIINPLIFSREKLDLLHIPHFNAPILYRGKLAITIHDLIKHFSTGSQTTTLPGYIYYLKRLAYKLIVYLNIKKARIIITPSKYWQDYLVDKYFLNPSKVFVTYEAVNSNFSKTISDKSIINKYHLKKPFLVYTGNLYPHKNIPTLINAVKQFNQKHTHQLQLVIICSRSIFQESIPKLSFIKILENVSDHDLASIYYQGLALVQPSFIEGFGLTGLEAMAANLPVLSSKSTCLPEIYTSAALYFDPHSVDDLVEKINLIITDQKLTNDLIEKGKIRVKQFSWHKMAKETKVIYSKALS
jgi:glycosyltransferase involved in cell wall biosynthesis